MDNTADDFAGTDPFNMRQIFPDAHSVFTCKPTPQLAAVKEDCVVVLDTNVLLVPYTIAPKSLAEIGATYKKLKEQGRLFIPAQVAREFANRRASKLGELHQQLHTKLSKIELLYKGQHPLLEMVSEYSLVRDVERAIDSKLPEYRDALRKLIDRVRTWNWDDPVSNLYSQIFDATTVWDMTASDDELETEFKSRTKRKQPPGYKDAGKDSNSSGDFVIWKTILELGSCKEKALLFVCNESKADWWHRSAGQPLYARYELIDEYLRTSKGNGFYLSSFADFLATFGVGAAVVDEIRVEESVTAELSGGSADDSGLQSLKSKVSDFPLGAFLAAMSYLERMVSDFVDRINVDSLKRFAHATLLSHRLYEKVGVVIPEPLKGQLAGIRISREMYEKGNLDPDAAHVNQVIDVISNFERFLTGLDVEKIKQAASEWQAKGKRQFQAPLRF